MGADDTTGISWPRKYATYTEPRALLTKATGKSRRGLGLNIRRVLSPMMWKQLLLVRLLRT